MTRSRFDGVCVALLLLWSTGALAAPKRVGIPKFDGKQEALIRKGVMKALKAHGYELVKSREMEDAISSTGAQLDSDDGLKTLAKELALAAIITGEVGPRRAKIVVHDGSEGSVLGDASFSGANPHKLSVEVGRDFWRKLGADVGRGQVPRGAKKNQKAAASDSAEDNEESPESGEGGDEAAPSEKKGKSKPEPEAAASEEAAPEAEAPLAHRKKPKPKMETPPEEAEGTPSSLPWLDVEVGGGGLNRNLSFYQPAPSNNPTLLPYSLGLGPIVIGKVVFYPVAPFDGGVLADLGVEGSIEQAFVSSTLQSGSGSFSNVVHEFAGGLRYRFPFAGTDNVYVSATGGEHAFTFSGANRIGLAIPDTIYHYIRPGAGLRVAVTHEISLSLTAGYRYVFNQAGPQFSGSHYFPHLTVAGADAEIGGGYALNSNFEVRAAVGWRRYWYAMHSTAADQTAGMELAGGAVDQSFTFTAAIAFLYGETAPKSEAGGEEAPPPPPPKPNAKGRKRHSADSDDQGEGGDSDSGDSSDKSGGDKSGGDKSGGDDDQ
jgi:hypothetical protein